MGGAKTGPAPAASPVAGRLCIMVAAVVWSTSGALTKLLREDTVFHLNEPKVEAVQIAFYRALFAGSVLALFVRRREVRFRPAMVPTVLSFAVMNATFVAAMAGGKAANAILLQYTAPMWMYLASIWLLGEPADPRGGISLAIGLVGIGVILIGGWQGGELSVMGLGLASGLGFAGVLIGLRVMRGESPGWLTVVNHFFGALALLPWVIGEPVPTLPQFVVLFLYGALQMGLPYLLMAQGLRSVSPQEAGTLTLLEPILNPVWAYLASPATEALHAHTLVGGAFILGALAYRYWPRRPPMAKIVE